MVIVDKRHKHKPQGNKGWEEDQQEYLELVHKGAGVSSKGRIECRVAPVENHLNSSKHQ